MSDFYATLGAGLLLLVNAYEQKTLADATAKLDASPKTVKFVGILSKNNDMLKNLHTCLSGLRAMRNDEDFAGWRTQVKPLVNYAKQAYQ